MTFPPASGTPSEESLNVTIIDDMAVESDHSFTVSITGTSLTAVTAGSPSSATVSIIDNDGQYSSYSIVSVGWYMNSMAGEPLSLTL